MLHYMHMGVAKTDLAELCDELGSLLPFHKSWYDFFLQATFF